MTTAPAPLCAQYAGLWPAADQAIAAAVCTCESHGDPNALCDSCAGVPEYSQGLWQINTLANTEFAGWNLRDPATNARAAMEIKQRQGWNAWSTYANNCYQQYLSGYTPVPLPRVGGLSQRGIIFLGLAAAFAVVAL